ncbi:replication initiator protein A [Roseomonas mucosa]|uniref:replication initiator protein A n=1 Tax=Roseomonas mucosa TaxID=207340 RepID=UPI001EF70497|nr:replication initiator protein A [Roseomonas mucosa]MCG7357634.1 replication initiator protein A [Roseomonas mucosa]
MSERRAGEGQFDLFVPVVTDLPLRDQRETMERPFFSLSKGKRLKPIDYTSPDGEVWVKVLPHHDYGMATIWDADILIWAASVFTEMRKRRFNEVPRTLTFQPFDVLRAIGRRTGGTDYRLLREALARLQATVVKTNIRAKGRRKERQFGWIEGWTDLVDERTGQSRGMTLTVSEWFYEGVLMDGGVLAVDPAYFGITSGRERWLYRVARKHAGGHGAEGFAVSLPTLFEKSGAEGDYRRFKFELRRITERDALPEFHLTWEEPQGPGKGRGDEPCLRMTRRSSLDLAHPAFKMGRSRRAGRPVPDNPSPARIRAKEKGA